jgi:Isoleucyl-tRNA synthetase
MEILVTLTKIIAPVLVFTADEIWQYLPESVREQPSVHLTMWDPVPEPTAEEKAFMQRWERLLAVRREVTKALEKARNEKFIGASTEAAVEIAAPPGEAALLREFSDDELKEIFIVSAVAVRETDGELSVAVSPAPGQKCQRCWRYDESVGQSTDHPALCRRCVEVVSA